MLSRADFIWAQKDHLPLSPQIIRILRIKQLFSQIIFVPLHAEANAHQSCTIRFGKIFSLLCFTR